MTESRSEDKRKKSSKLKQDQERDRMLYKSRKGGRDKHQWIKGESRSEEKWKKKKIKQVK